MATADTVAAATSEVTAKATGILMVDVPHQRPRKAPVVPRGKLGRIRIWLAEMPFSILMLTALYSGSCTSHGRFSRQTVQVGAKSRLWNALRLLKACGRSELWECEGLVRDAQISSYAPRNVVGGMVIWWEA